MSSLSHSTKPEPLPESKITGLSLPVFLPARQSTAPGTLQIFTDGDPLPPSRRLVIILPDANFDILTLPRRIWTLAAPDRRQVLILAKPEQEENEFRVRMNLATLASLIRDPWITVQTHLVAKMSLAEAVRQTIQPDDLLICFSEHSLPGFFKKTRLADTLAQATQLPVYTLKGSIEKNAQPVNARLVDIFLLIFGLATLIAFFTLEVWIDQNTAGALRTILQILAVFAEVWVVAACATHSLKI
jgi:hypothetical protein